MRATYSRRLTLSLKRSTLYFFAFSFDLFELGFAGATVIESGILTGASTCMRHRGASAAGARAGARGSRSAPARPGASGRDRSASADAMIAANKMHGRIEFDECRDLEFAEIAPDGRRQHRGGPAP